MQREEGEFPGGSEGEIRGINDTVENAETNYDGHGERKQSAEIAKTVKSLWKEVQSYRADNERMLIQLNDRLVHKLNETQRQMSFDSKRRRVSHKEKKHFRGLTNTHATFMGLMNGIFKNYLDKFIIVFWMIFLYTPNRKKSMRGT